MSARNKVELLDKDQLATCMGLSPHCIDWLRGRYRIPFVRLGGVVRYIAADVYDAIRKPKGEGQ